MPTRRPLRPRSDAATLARQLGARTALGAVVGGTAVALDRVLPSVALSVTSVRTLLGALVTAVVTAGVFSLWMRTVAIGLVSDEFPPRTLVVFLDDRFQVRLAGWMSAALAFQIVTLTALPGDDADGVPVVSPLLAAVVALMAVAGVLYAVTHAVSSVDLTRLVSRLAEEVRRVVHELPTDPPTPPRPEVELVAAVRSDGAGWVVDVDRDAILAALPPGRRALLVARRGDFVAAEQPLVWLDTDEADEDRRTQVRDAVLLARDARSRDDLALAISQLIDVADRALSQPSSDTSTAHEALLQFTAVACELLAQGLPHGHRHDPEQDRWLVDGGAWDVADHLKAALERLRGPAARDPLAARQLAAALSTLRDHALEVGDTRAAATMRRQARHLVALAEAEGAIDEDLDQLRVAAGLADGEGS